MTASESDDLCLLYCIGSMKSLMCEAVLALYFRLVPLVQLQVKSPQIVQVWAARFSSYNDHESTHQCGSVVGPGRWQVELIVLLVALLIIDGTFGEFGYIDRPIWGPWVAILWLVNEWICIIAFFFHWEGVGLVEKVNGLSLLVILKSHVLITDFGKFRAI